MSAFVFPFAVLVHFDCHWQYVTCALTGG